MAYDIDQWQRIKAYYEAGLSLLEILNKPEVTIEQRSTIHARAKREGWIKGKSAQLMQDEIEIKPKLERINAYKKMMSKPEFEVWCTLLKEKMDAVQFLDACALENTRQAMELPCESQHEIKARADTISKSKDTIIGKSPETSVQVNNNNQPQKIVYEVIDSSATNK